MRGIVQQMYGGDTLITSFQSDTVLFDGNNKFYKFDGRLRTDSINFDKINLSSGQDLLINYADGDYMSFDQSGDNVFDLSLNGGNVSLYMDAGNNNASITSIGTYTSAINVGSTNGEVSISGEDATRSATVTMAGDGLVYSGDYSSTLTDRAIPDFGKIKSTIHDSIVASGGGGSSYTFTNGLTESPAGTVNWGGAISGNRAITKTLSSRTSRLGFGLYNYVLDYPTSFMSFRTGSDSAFVQVGGDFYSEIGYQTSAGKSSLFFNGTNSYWDVFGPIRIQSTQSAVTGTLHINSEGLRYGSDQSSRWFASAADSLRFIPDIGWVRDEIQDSLSVPYAEMYMIGNTTATTVSVADTWYTATGGTFVLGNASKITHSSGVLTIPSGWGGKYEFSLSITVSAQTINDTGRFGLSKNNGDPNDWHARKRKFSNNDIGAMTTVGIINLAAGDNVRFKLENVGGTGDFTVDGFTLIIKFIGR